MCAFRKSIAICMYVYIIVTSVYVGFSLASNRVWTQNNDWETTRNWNLQRLPCGNDIVKIDVADVGIFLNSTSTIKELTFAKESSIVLGDSAEIVFSQQDSGSKTCQGDEISFTGFGSNDWFDPKNWQTESTSNDIGLYLQEIPCQYDMVTFPKDSSYSVKISKNVSVAQVIIGGKEREQNELDQYISTHSGVQEIWLENSSSFHVTGHKCQDVSGCICDNKKYEDYICSFVTCPKLHCDKPVKPFGGCCSICGNLLLLNFTSGFNKTSVEKQIETYLKESPGIIFVSMKYEEMRVQVIFWEDSYSDDSKTLNAARSIGENLSADEKWHVTGFEILPRQSSGHAKSKTDGVDAVTIGSIIGGGFVFIVLAMLVVVVIFKQKRLRLDVNVVEERNEREMENPVVFHDEHVNPLYEIDLEMDSLGFSNALSVEDQTKKDDDGTVTDMENPLYEPAEAPSAAD